MLDLEKGLIIQRTSVKDWYNLILEARGVINERVSEVSVKYVEPVNCCSMEYDFNYTRMAPRKGVPCPEIHQRKISFESMT